MKLHGRLLLLSVVTAVLAVATLLGVSSLLARHALESAAQSKLSALESGRHNALTVFFNSIEAQLRVLARTPDTRGSLAEFSRAFAQMGEGAQDYLQQEYVASNLYPREQRDLQEGGATRYNQIHDRYHPVYRDRRRALKWDDLLLIDAKGNVVYSVLKENDLGTNVLTGPWKDSGLARAVRPLLRNAVPGALGFADFSIYTPDDNIPASFLAAPIFDQQEKRFLGVVAIQLPGTPFHALIHDTTGMGETGESLIVGTGGWMLTSSRFEDENIVLKKQLNTFAVKSALAGEEGLIKDPDYRGVPSYIAFKPLQPFQGALGDQPRWGLITKIDQAEALADLYVLERALFWGGGVIGLVAVLLGIFGARSVSRPVLSIRNALSQLAQGEEAPVPGLDRRDEIGDMAKAAESFRTMAQQIKNSHWINEHVAEISNGVSAQSSMKQVPDVVLSGLCDSLDVPVGALYFADEQGAMVRAGAHGLVRRSQADDRFEPGVALVGQCAKDGHPVILSPVPNGVAVIGAGLSEFTAHELVLYPIKHKDTVLAVLELAALRTLAPSQHEFLAATCASLGLHLANLQAAEHNLRLLGETRKQAAALEEQQTALRLSNEEMRSLTEELRSQSEELKAQNEEFRANQEELRAQQDEMEHKNEILEVQGRQLEQARSDAEAKARELERANRYKSEFLANMSHELRTPLNSILILAKDLAENEDDNLTPSQVESAAVIHESGNQLLTLINDILDLSKIEAGRMELQSDHFPLDEMFAYLRRVFAPLAEKKGIGFSMDVASSMPETIQGDRQRITQVLTNLLSNAVKFTDEGTVKITACRRDTDLRFDVVDTGIGIPAEKMESLFGVFQQGDGSTSRKYGGSGLGLSIAKRLVDLMGGTITVTSAPGQGSTFSVVLPDAQVDTSTAALASAPSRQGSAATVSLSENRVAGSILVVEDDSRLVSILERLIDALGLAVTAVGTGEEALMQIEREQPSGILLDLGLPGIQGMEVLRHLKSSPATSSIPVYIMSGAEDTGEAKTLGACGFLKKPVTKKAITTAVKTMAKFEGDAERFCVLLIEDNEADIHALQTLFRHDPVDLVPVKTGGDALSLLRSSAVDGVILDLMLPDVAGFDWLTQFCKEPGHPPVVVYSARELSKDELFRLRECTVAVVTKGKTHERLRDEVLLALRTGQQKVPHTPPGALPFSGRRLLLVDDDVSNLFALAKALRGKGFTVEVAPTGAKALEMLASDRFDVVLCDIMMPEMDGYALIRRIREQGYRDLPLIAVTAKAMRGDVELCLRAGANDYVAKPVDVDNLIAIIRKWL